MLLPRLRCHSEGFAMSRKRFGVFPAPLHPDDEDLSEQIHRDGGLVEHLEALGFHETWLGEHHCAGFEITGSPIEHGSRRC